MLFNNKGNLVVNVTTANGAIPEMDALVIIQGGDENSSGIVTSFLTDTDGVGWSVSLPAPSRSLSQSPGATEKSFAVYDIVVSLDGFYKVRISNVAVFEGETTVQPVNLIPLPIYQNNSSYPRGNLVVISRENEKLE